MTLDLLRSAARAALPSVRPPLIIKLELPDQLPFRDLSTGQNFDMRRLSESS